MNIIFYSRETLPRRLCSRNFRSVVSKLQYTWYIQSCILTFMLRMHGVGNWYLSLLAVTSLTYQNGTNIRRYHIIN